MSSKIPSTLPITLALALSAAGAAAQAGELKGSIVHLCEDGSEWPPYTYYQRVNGKPTKVIEGFAVDVTDAIFKKAGIGYTIELLPWARCQKEIEQGTSFQMALNASYSDARAKTYHLSRAFYRTVNYYFYSRRNHPQGLTIDGVEDLKKYRVCGLYGYSYAAYGLPEGAIDQGAREFNTLILKLHAGRCDLFVEKYEVMVGFTVIGQPYLADKDLGAKPIPGMAPGEFHIMISRRYEHAEQLLKIVNEGLTELEASKQMGNLLKKYIP